MQHARNEISIWSGHHTAAFHAQHNFSQPSRLQDLFVKRPDLHTKRLQIDRLLFRPVRNTQAATKIDEFYGNAHDLFDPYRQPEHHFRRLTKIVCIQLIGNDHCMDPKTGTA